MRGRTAKHPSPSSGDPLPGTGLSTQKLHEVAPIAKALGRSEKTIRTYRDKAFAALRAAMADGDER